MIKDGEISNRDEWDNMSVDQIISQLTTNANYDWENDNPVIFLNHLLQHRNQKNRVITALQSLEGKLIRPQKSGAENLAMMLGFFLTGVKFKVFDNHENTEHWESFDTNDLKRRLVSHASGSNALKNTDVQSSTPEEFMHLVTGNQSSLYFPKSSTIIAGLRELKNREEKKQSDLWKMLHFFLSGVEYLRT